MRLLTLRKLLCVVLTFAIISGSVSLFYFLKFSAMVDRRLDGEVFKYSAKIYAAATDLGQPAGVRSTGNRATRISFQGSLIGAGAGKLSRTPPTFMTNFFDASRAKSRPVEFHEIPKLLITAVLSGEDQDFYNHHGIDPRRIAGASLWNFRRGALAQGASTITQQLARSLFLSREPTLQRKLSEAFIALLLERRLTKEQILTMYANEVYLGNRDSFAIHGFGEAAKAYFGRDLKDLNLSEVATLAGIIPAPNAYSPVQHPDRAEARRNLILRIMLNTGSVTRDEYEEAKRSEIEIAANLDPAEGHYFVDYIREALLRDFSEEMLMTGGLSVATTVDLPLQKAAIDSVDYGLALVNAQFAKRSGKPHEPNAPMPQAGLIALDPQTGEIKAMVGGARYSVSQYNRITQALRQPGSIFKPFVFAAALETALEGFSVFDLNPNDDLDAAPITPITMLIDEPIVFYSAAQEYIPKNYSGEYRGEVLLRNAFQESLNVPTVSLAQLIGYDRVAKFAIRMGMNSRIRGYPSVALGAFEVTPLEIAGAYTAFANGGQRVEPHALRQVLSDDGKVLKSYAPEPQKVLSPQVAYLMTHLMEGVINHGTGAGVRARGFMLPAAGKTGTSRDGWFAGYTKDLLVITWVGFDDGRDLHLEGAKSALPIWVEFMKKAYQLYPARNSGRMDFSPPPGIELVNVDAATLLRGDPSCGDSFEEAFLVGTAPTGSCVVSPGSGPGTSR